MPKRRVLSGREAVAILEAFGFRRHSQKGSHIKLRRDLPNGSHETLVVPDHSELDRGTLSAVIRQASRFIPEADLRTRFDAADDSR